jgi:hypothetical protein
MAGIQDFWCFEDDFIGGGTIGTSAGVDPWVATITGTTPTVTRIDLSETAGVYRPGVAQLIFAGTEIQNVCLSFGNKLSFDINKTRGFECGLRYVAEASSKKDTTTTMAWGLTGDRNDAIDSVAIASIFRLAGAADIAAQPVVVENDDATNTNDDVATGLTMTDLLWYKFKIDLSDLDDVKMYGGLATGGLSRLAQSTTIKMSAYGGGLQPFFQIQKTSDANTDALQIDYVRVWGVR